MILQSIVSVKSYLTVRCHFVFSEKLEARVLATKELFGSHTGENIANDLKNILTGWNIITKVVTVISDNGANMKRAINDFL